MPIIHPIIDGYWWFGARILSELPRRNWIPSGDPGEAIRGSRSWPCWPRKPRVELGDFLDLMIQHDSKCSFESVLISLNYTIPVFGFQQFPICIHMVQHHGCYLQTLWPWPARGWAVCRSRVAGKDLAARADRSVQSFPSNNCFLFFAFHVSSILPKYITALQEIRYTMLLMKLGNAQKNGVYLQYQMGRFSTHDASSLVQEFEKPLETQVAQPFPDSELEYITKCRKQKEFRKMFFSRTSRSHLMQFKAEWDWHNLSGHFRWMISNDFSASQLANEGLCNMVKGNIAVVRQKEGGSCPLCSCKPWEGICHRKSMLPFPMCMECYLFQQEHRECSSIGDIYEMLGHYMSITQTSPSGSFQLTLKTFLPRTWT